MQPVSVIIVNFNAGKYLTDCIKSVLSSSIPVEVIVSDNGSTDDSLIEVRKAFPYEKRLRIIENGANLGFAKANNLAFQKSSGQYILFLNPDCIIRENTLQQLLRIIEPKPSVGMAGCLILNPDGSEQAGCRRSIPTPWRSFVRLTLLYKLAKWNSRFNSYDHTELPLPQHPIQVEAISGAFMLVRRGAIDQAGLLDEGYFMHCEDLDWCMRFKQAGWSIIFIPTVEIIHIGGICSVSRPILVEYYKHKGMVRFYNKFFRHRYPQGLMFLVILAVWFRFTIRAALSLFYQPKITKTISEPRQLAISSIRPDHDV
jgi:GT2 family glycosyltransferase